MEGAGLGTACGTPRGRWVPRSHEGAGGCQACERRKPWWVTGVRVEAGRVSPTVLT